MTKYFIRMQRLHHYKCRAEERLMSYYEVIIPDHTQMIRPAPGIHFFYAESPARIGNVSLYVSVF